MSPAPIEMIGRKFGRLTVVKACANRGRERVYACRCECGSTLDVIGNSLRTGNTKSCGCGRRESCTKRSTKHGQAGSKIYWIWADMVARCSNPRHQRYADYGARGIKVCRRWQKFENFYADMGDRPPLGTLDRKHNSQGYSKQNCRWASPLEQANNKRNNRLISFRGQIKTLAGWSRATGIPYDTLKGRLNRRWPVEQALTREVGKWL